VETTISLFLSLLAVIVSGVTAWLTLLKRGTVKMTQPTVVYFGPDRSVPHKVFLRTILYATAKRGCIVESMFIRLRRAETTQTYGEVGHLSRGSGLFVPDTGFTTDHHFLLPFDDATFAFLPGAYTIELFASIVGERSTRRLTSIELAVTAEQSAELGNGYGLYFDWSPDATDYQSHIDHQAYSESTPVRSASSLSPHSPDKREAAASLRRFRYT
jgi:hypothetical protein